MIDADSGKCVDRCAATGTAPTSPPMPPTAEPAGEFAEATQTASTDYVAVQSVKPVLARVRELVSVPSTTKIFDHQSRVQIFQSSRCRSFNEIEDLLI